MINPGNKKSCVFFGSYPMSLFALEALLKLDFIEVSAVITSDPPNKTSVFENAVRRFLKEGWADIRLIEVKTAEEMLSRLHENLKVKPDILVSCAYPLKIPDTVIDYATMDAVNVHPSFLPKLRGADPIRQAILQGCEKTGVTLHRLVEEFDAGAIYGQKELVLNRTENLGELHMRLCELTHELVLESMIEVVEEKEPVEQNENEVTHAKAVTDEDRKISPDMDIKKIDRIIRANFPYSKAWLEHGNFRYYLGNKEVSFMSEPCSKHVSIDDEFLTISNETGSIKVDFERVEVDG